MVADLPNYRQSAVLSAREKAALRLAEVLAGDHREASQELFDELRRHFTEGEIIDLGLRITAFVGFGRLVRALGFDTGNACPLPEAAPPAAR